MNVEQIKYVITFDVIVELLKSEHGRIYETTPLISPKKQLLDDAINSIMENRNKTNFTAGKMDNAGPDINIFVDENAGLVKIEHTNITIKKSSAGIIMSSSFTLDMTNTIEMTKANSENLLFNLNNGFYSNEIEDYKILINKRDDPLQFDNSTYYLGIASTPYNITVDYI